MSHSKAVKKLRTTVVVAAVCVPTLFAACGARSVKGTRPDIFLIVIDTLRSDVTGCCPGGPSFTPLIDEVAKDGIVFERTLSQAANTHPAMAALFTSRLTFEFQWSKENKSYLTDRFHTLAEWLRDLGYDTHGIVTNPYVAERLGFGQGFNSYVMRLMADSAVVTECALSRIESLDKAPRFLYLHYYFPHCPYRRHEEFLSEAVMSYDGPYRDEFGWREARRFRDPNLLLEEEELQYVRWMYESETELTDRAVGAFIEALREQGLYRDSLIIICADHGEEFQEHRAMGHAHAVYEEVIHVPLIVKLPGNERGGTRVKARVRLIDVLPTVADVLKADFPQEMLGESLLPLAAGSETSKDRTVISAADDHHECIYLDNLKYVRSRALVLSTGRVAIPEDRQEELFDMSSDPVERVDVSRDLPEKVTLLRRVLDEAKKRGAAESPPARPEEVLDEETLNALRTVGYI